MNIKKNLILTLAVAMGIVVSSPSVNALEGVSCDELSTETVQYIIEQTDPNDLDLSCKNGTPYTDEYLQRIDASFETMNNEPKVQPRYFTHMLNVTPYEQLNSYYCGPASLKAVVQFMTGSSKSQSQYASELGTSSSLGTYVYKFRNVINTYVSKQYNYVLGNTKTQDQFKTMLESSVDNNKPLVMHTMTKTLALYNGHQTGHYIVAIGNTVSATYPYTVYYIDSNTANYGKGSVFGQHTDSLANIYNSVNLYGDRYLIY